MGRLFEGAIFDLDGVITNTAPLHEKAWRQALHPFHLSHEQFLRCFDGRSREAGLAAYLKDEDSSANPTWMATTMQRKALVYDSLIKAAGSLVVYSDALRALEFMASLGVPCAVASSSKAAPEIVRQAGLSKYFKTVSTGEIAKPQIYHDAARSLGLTLADCAVFEDSPHAVQLAIDAGAKYVTFVRKERR